MSVLNTNRLVLRPFKEDDAQAMFNNWTYDERVAKFCRWYPHQSVEDTEQLLKIYLDEHSITYKYRWAIVLKNTTEPIGAIDVVDITDDGKTAEIGYVLSYENWNKGYVSEAFEKVITELFSQGFSKIIAVHHVENIASGKVMEKNRMTFTHFDKAQEKFGSDELCDVKCYSIIKP